MTLIAIFKVRKEALDLFRAYEEKAARIMAKHGGAIERTIVVSQDAGSKIHKEVHIITFPSGQDLRDYQNDAELREILSLRANSIIDTEILQGIDGPKYGSAP